MSVLNSFCPVCGTPWPPEATACSKCGHRRSERLGWTPPPGGTAPPPAEAREDAVPSEPPRPPEPRPEPCPRCGTPKPPGASVCPHCGYARLALSAWPPVPLRSVPPVPPVPFCANCGALWPPGAAFCPHCDHVPTRRPGGGGQGSPPRPSETTKWAFMGLSAAGCSAAAVLFAVLAVAALGAAFMYVLDQIPAACNKITSGI